MAFAGLLPFVVMDGRLEVWDRMRQVASLVSCTGPVFHHPSFRRNTNPNSRSRFQKNRFVLPLTDQRLICRYSSLIAPARCRVMRMRVRVETRWCRLVAIWLLGGEKWWRGDEDDAENGCTEWRSSGGGVE
ncbi:hypothetical protein Nepgr_032460 [Nepenthes gracilis]|uniref:Uncharacterized protein n=1 Tax=Nepenthes gracilis TaxID=150966 RepID=A0AAD3TKW8_NEPGR|nr:hypothetical protein Nepgr_032460 [Nepenthes gracilis]